MLLHGINDNIIIPRLSYLDVCQDEEKLDLYKDIDIFGGSEQNQQKTGKQRL